MYLEENITYLDCMTQRQKQHFLKNGVQNAKNAPKLK